MTRKKKKIRRKKPGLPPGSLVFTGHRENGAPVVRLVQFSEEHYSEKSSSSEFKLEKHAGQITWLDVRGLYDTTLLESIGREFKLHPLVMEDVLNVQQRPKFEEYPNGVFIVARALNDKEDSLQLETKQISIFFGKDYIISFQESNHDTFESVRERLKSGRRRIRTTRPDYLAYALLDKILDDYFYFLDKLEELMEKLEDDISENPDDGLKSVIHGLKFQLLRLRKSVISLREAINSFSHSESEYVMPETRLFLRDLHDHAIRIADLVDTYRDIAMGLQELYLSVLSMRMNQVMQLLTIVTTIFVPLTFIVGVYGMNFKYMPELKWRYGYLAVWVIMLLLGAGLLYLFRKKKWL